MAFQMSLVRDNQTGLRIVSIATFTEHVFCASHFSECFT